MADRRVVIIGGGHNGLITAFYLAKAGFKPLVLERRAQDGTGTFEAAPLDEHRDSVDSILG